MARLAQCYRIVLAQPPSLCTASTVPTLHGITSAHVGHEGALVGRYRLLEHLGSGGMGSVWRAHDAVLDRDVAVKLLRGQSGEDSCITEEGRALARVAHPNVVEVFETGRCDGGRAFVAMELIEGVDLRTLMHDEGARRLEIVAHLLDAGRGLAATHRAGLVHRDFKPGNVAIGKDGRVRVIDFGLATDDVSTDALSLVDDEVEDDAEDDTLVRETAGTLAYMAPEQHGYGPITAAADQFAFCVSLYEALFGVRPYQGESRADFALAKLAGPPPMPRHLGVSSRWCTALKRGLDPDPRRRFRSMDALLAALGPAYTAVRPNRLASIRTAAAAIVALAPAFLPS